MSSFAHIVPTHFGRNASDVHVRVPDPKGATRLAPVSNTVLSGLRVSFGNFRHQAEASQRFLEGLGTSSNGVATDHYRKSMLRKPVPRPSPSRQKRSVMTTVGNNVMNTPRTVAQPVQLPKKRHNFQKDFLEEFTETDRMWHSYATEKSFDTEVRQPAWHVDLEDAIATRADADLQQHSEHVRLVKTIAVGLGRAEGPEVARGKTGRFKANVKEDVLRVLQQMRSQRDQLIETRKLLQSTIEPKDVTSIDLGKLLKDDQGGSLFSFSASRKSAILVAQAAHETRRGHRNAVRADGTVKGGSLHPSTDIHPQEAYPAPRPSPYDDARSKEVECDALQDIQAATSKRRQSISAVRAKIENWRPPP